MADPRSQTASAPPPSYGAVTAQVQGQPPYPAQGNPQGYPAVDQPTQVYPPYPAGEQPPQYPQPGQAPPQVYPTEPPPKYEPPKESEAYPPQGVYPQAGVYPQQGYQAYPVTTQTTVVVPAATFGPNPMTLECPNCHAFVTSTISYESGGLTWLSSALLCLVGCWCGCQLVPFCMEGMKDVHHTCPSCNKRMGTFRRL